MKRLIYVFAALFMGTTSSLNAQTNTFIPELVFQNPVLTSGTAGQDGATYKFSNVATGIDATVKIKSRSGSSVVLTNIDVSNLGWTKAFQPQLGIPGNVAANQDWWMDFEMCFYKAGTDNKAKIKGFSVTAIDIDGDGVSIREYLQMNKVSSITYCPVNYLAPQAAAAMANTSSSDDDPDNAVGTDKKSLGPVQNFVNIDTLSTPVMATYTYANKDKITFRYGAKSGSIVSNAGERLNSLWFKAFNLVAPSTLPISFYSFTASYDKKNAVLNWTAQADDNMGSFIIEKSTDGNKFTSIGQVTATERMNAYNFTDVAITSATGMVYYRIQSREKTGEVNYSAIKIIKLGKETSTTISVYPSPVQSLANLTLPAAWQNKPVMVSIYNGAGSQMQTISIKAAGQTETLNLQNLSRGIYIVKAQCNGEWSEQRILKN